MTRQEKDYRLDPTLPVADEVRRVATARLDVAVTLLRESPSPSGANRAAAAAAIEEVRSLLRLVRGGLDGQARRAANRRLRSALQLVAADRHQQVNEVFECAARAAFDTVTTAALHRLRASIDQQTMLQSSVEALADERWADLGDEEAAASWSFTPWVSLADELDAAILGATLWAIDGDGFEPFARGFEREYRRGREVLFEVAGDLHTEGLGMLSDRVRSHLQHLALLRAAWPKVVKPMVKEVENLAVLIERQYDLGVLRAKLLQQNDRQLRRDARALVGVLDQDRSELSERVAALGARVYADEPATITHRFSTWWAAARV